MRVGTERRGGQFDSELRLGQPPVAAPQVIPFGLQNVIYGQAGGTVIILGNIFPIGERPPAGPPLPENYLSVASLRAAIAGLEGRIRDLQQVLGKQVGEKQLLREK